jgi:hypothetical protein
MTVSANQRGEAARSRRYGNTGSVKCLTEIKIVDLR